MPEKPFKVMETNDALREAFLDEHNGRAPNYFIESAMGGSVDSAPNPEAIEAAAKLGQRLTERLYDLGDGKLPEGALLWDKPGE